MIKLYTFGMKKHLCTIFLFFASCFLGSAFGYLEDKVYCKFEGEQLTLYVKKEEGLTKCATYLKSLEQMIHQTYDEVLLAMQYLRSEEDVFYRKEVFEEKKNEFLSLYLYKTKLVEAVSSFEAKFFALYQTSLTRSLTPYVETLQKVQERLSQETQKNPEDRKIRSLYQGISQQIVVIWKLLNATTLDEIMEHLPAYLYFKQSLQ
jgi:tRNA nucleotidyltransferase/poly(A) polymerase